MLIAFVDPNCLQTAHSFSKRCFSHRHMTTLRHTFFVDSVEQLAERCVDSMEQLAESM
jgi:hypothetical protein